jgi:hypothetical protein
LIVALLTVQKREARAMLLGRLKNFIVFVDKSMDHGRFWEFRLIWPWRFVQWLAGSLVGMNRAVFVFTAIRSISTGLHA